MYIVCKCQNIDDVNDLLQDTYVELYKILKRKKSLLLENCQNYIIGIAKKKLQKYYGLLYQLKTVTTWDNEKEYEIEIPADIDIEMETITKAEAEEVWEYIKKKEIYIIKVFYLYYHTELKISQIAQELEISESKVKNILYRTAKEIKKNVKIEGEENE